MDRYLPIGCYGKLPVYGDYIRVRCNLPTSQSLVDWLHSGREETSLTGAETEASKRKNVDFRAHRRFLIGVPGSAELLAGVVRPSEGRGDRRFPFAVFVHFPRRLYSRHYALLPFALASVWEELDSAWDSLASVASKAAFDEVLESIDVPSPRSSREIREEYKSRQNQPVAGLFDRGDGASLASLEKNIPDVFARLGKKADGGRILLEMPVSKDLDEACFDASVWIDLFNRQFFLKRFEPCVLLDERRDAVSRHVLLKFGPLRPVDYPAAAGMEGEESVVSRPAHGEKTRDEAAVEDQERGGDEGTTYGDLLGKRFGVHA